MKTIAKIAALAALAAAAAMPLHAQQPSGPIETRLEQRKVVRAADGKETFAPADPAKPGDVIEYVATYRNKTRQQVVNLEATLPIPTNTEFIPGSARPANAKASVDGRSFSDPPLTRKVVRNGLEVDEPIPVREYRYLRWYPGDLAGEKSLEFGARVKVTDDALPRESGKGGGK